MENCKCYGCTTMRHPCVNVKDEDLLKRYPNAIEQLEILKKDFLSLSLYG